MNTTVHDSSLSNTLAALEAELHHPGAVCTRERLEQLLHAEFHEVGRSGRPYTREFVIEALLGNSLNRNVLPTDYVASELTDGSVLLTYRTVQLAADGKHEFPAMRMSIWLRTSIGWQLRYHQGTPAAES
jgi:hypothetical protein